MDWNNDGKKDLLVGESYDNAPIRVYLNTGSNINPSFSGFSYVQVGGTNFLASNQAMPEPVDWNNDGKFDLLCGHINGQIFKLINIGALGAPVFTNTGFVKNGAGNLWSGWRSSPVVTDWNEDGKKDLLVGVDTGYIYYYQNTGSDSNPVFNGSVKLTAGGQDLNAAGGYARPAVVDLDGDGLKDLVVGNYDGTVQYYQALNPNRPNFSLKGWVVNDAGGNTNGCLDPGESLLLTVCVSNSACAATNVTLTLSSADPYVTMVNPTISAGVVASNRCVLNGLQPFGVKIATNAPNARDYSLALAVAAIAGDGAACTSRFSFAVAGYMALAASNSWVDTTGGTVLAFGDGDEGSVLVDFGFGVPFYGQVRTQTYVNANGYLAFLAPPAMSYQNATIPSAPLPNAMVAPLWTDLDLNKGGTIRCKGFGVAPNRYWAVEWNGIRHYSYTNEVMTFEAILYETGKIKFQYGPLLNLSGVWSGYTIGIENDAGDGGVQVACEQPNTVTNGQAIEFFFPLAPVDSDGGGLPDSWERFYFGGTGHSATNDDDGDGMRNEFELVAGTDPYSTLSVLRLERLDFASSNGVSLSWPSVPGRKYVVEANTNLMTSTWFDATPAAVTGGASCVSCSTATVQQAVRQILYRVNVRQ